jgi:hypothetical protein
LAWKAACSTAIIRTNDHYPVTLPEEIECEPQWTVTSVTPAGAGRLQPAAAADPTIVVQNYYAALNAKDLDRAMSLVAAAVFCNPHGGVEGADAIRPTRKTCSPGSSI